MKRKEESCAFRTSIGGQALMEGILMRGPEKQAIVVRREDGSYVTREETLHPIRERYPILGWPFIRGTVNFMESMISGVKALNFSAEQIPEAEQEEKGKLEQRLEKKMGAEKFQKLAVGVAVALGIVLAVGLFILLPTVLAGLLAKVTDITVLRSLAEGVLRILIFLIYLWSVSGMKEIRRVWMYHGAEHKTIACYEAGQPLTVENCRPMRRFHPRCGTSFLFLVMIVSILIFSLVRWQNALIRMALRLVLLPVVVGISYELIRYAGRHDNLLTRILSAPGLWLQRLTTKEPEDEMLEVAIRALEMVLPEEQGADRI